MKNLVILMICMLSTPYLMAETTSSSVEEYAQELGGPGFDNDSASEMQFANIILLPQVQRCLKAYGNHILDLYSVSNIDGYRYFLEMTHLSKDGTAAGRASLVIQTNDRGDYICQAATSLENGTVSPK